MPTCSGLGDIVLLVYNLGMLIGLQIYGDINVSTYTYIINGHS